MTTTPTRDEFGVTHARGCTQPGYEAHTTTMPGVLILRCQHCDATRLTKGTPR